MSKKQVKMVNIHLTQIAKILGSAQFSYGDLLNLKAFLARAVNIVDNTLDKIIEKDLN